jgi:hypothetical protein
VCSPDRMVVLIDSPSDLRTEERPDRTTVLRGPRTWLTPLG